MKPELPQLPQLPQMPAHSARGRYNPQRPPASVPTLWRWTAILVLLLVSLGAGFFLGKVAFDQLKMTYPSPEITWGDRRAVKPSRMGKREFEQHVGLDRRFIEDSLRSLLAPRVSVFPIWKTCGDANCVRPSLGNIMSLLDQAEDKQQFVQRVCALGSRFVLANVAGVEWAYDAPKERCIAANWEAINQDVKAANSRATGLSIAVALASALLFLGLGLWILHAIVKRIDSAQQDISIEP
jgi:hypothetical protein